MGFVVYSSPALSRYSFVVVGVYPINSIAPKIGREKKS